LTWKTNIWVFYRVTSWNKWNYQYNFVIFNIINKITYFIYLDFFQNIYLTSILIPFSSDNRIHFVHEFKIKSLNFYNEKSSFFLIKELTKDITNFLNNLNETDNYWLSLSFYPRIEGYANNEGIQLHISDPILINKDSSPLLVTNFIMNRLNMITEFYGLDDSIINSRDSIIVVKYTEIELQ
jgi:hypothetical protein